MIREAVLAEARTWLGTPFHHKAMVKGVGVDCAHFLLGVFSAVGVVPRFSVDHYPPDWHFHRGEERFLGILSQYADIVNAPETGDVAMFKFGRCASHGAVVVAWPQVIHSYIGQGVVFTDAEGAELGGRLHSFWRVRGSS